MKQKSRQDNKYGYFPRKILGNILKVDRRRTSTNRAGTKKIITMHKALISRDGLDIVYVSKHEEGSRLPSF